MTTVLLAFLIMLLLVAGMAVGVVFGRKPISGSCGGMKALGMDMACEICGGNPDRCETSKVSETDSPAGSRADLYYRAND